MHEIEVWILVNESGEYGLGSSQETCADDFTTNCSTGEPTRQFHLKLQVPLPTAVTLTGQLPVEVNPQPVTLTVEV